MSNTTTNRKSITELVEEHGYNIWICLDSAPHTPVFYPENSIYVSKETHPECDEPHTIFMGLSHSGQPLIVRVWDSNPSKAFQLYSGERPEWQAK